MAISDQHLSVLETQFFKEKSGPFRDYLGKYSGRLLILGDGRTIWSDYEEYDKSSPFQTMAVKIIGAVWPDLDHWAHYHAEQFERDGKPGWLMEMRRVRAGRVKGARAPLRHVFHKTPRQNEWVMWPMSYGGNSAIFASLIAVALGYDEITLAGCPADSQGHYYEPPWVRNTYSGFDNRSHEKSWRDCRDQYFFGKVKSLSGNTKEWLS